MEVDQTSRHQELVNLYWDMYKDVHGIRPRWMKLDEMSIEELEGELLILGRSAAIIWEAEAKAQKEAAEKFEQQVASTGVDRETAIRWIMQAEDVDTLEDLEFQRNLPFGYFMEK